MPEITCIPDPGHVGDWCHSVPTNNKAWAPSGNDKNAFGHSPSQFQYEFDESSRIMK